MSITSFTLPNGVTVETSASLAEVVSLFGVQSAAPVVSAPSKTTPTERPTLTVVKPMSEHHEASKRTSKPKSAKPSDGKAVFAEMRRLQSTGDVAGAIRIAEGRGWHTEAAKLAEKLASPKTSKTTTATRGVGSNTTQVPNTENVRPVDGEKLAKRLAGEVKQAIVDKRLHEVITGFEIARDEAQAMAKATTGDRHANAVIVRDANKAALVIALRSAKELAK